VRESPPLHGEEIDAAAGLLVYRLLRALALNECAAFAAAPERLQRCSCDDCVDS
jgi:hypothetical protein